MFCFNKKSIVHVSSTKNTKISNKMITISNNNYYYKLTKDIRNYHTLTSNYLLFINTLNNDNLIEIIKIYDKVVESLVLTLNN